MPTLRFPSNKPVSTQRIDLRAPGLTIWKLKDVGLDQISLGVGPLGVPGSTAYAGLVDVLRCQKGETIWVSAAAGAVGSLVGMIAKNVYGCKVIGTAGGPEKCKIVVEEFGFDHCVDYKLAGNDARVLEKMIRKLAPRGIDMYFESVGGIHFSAAIKLLRRGGRIAVSGAIAVYNDDVPKADEIHIANMVYTMQRIEGFLCRPWLSGKVSALSV
jgi:NADPH-dependent curcumin reductase CurA